MNQQTNVVHRQQQSGGGGGLLRTLLRPFMPEVSAGIDAADSLLHGKLPSSSILGMASEALGGGGEVPGEGEVSPDLAPPGTIPNINAVGGGASGGSGQGGDAQMAEEANPNEQEQDGDQDDFTPEQMQSLNMIAQQFPTWNKDLQEDPGLLDGAGALISKLSNYYKRQSGAAQQPQQQQA